MRVFVTGVSGFIGHAVASNLAQKGHRVWGLDRNPKPVKGVESIEQGDILDFDLVKRCVGQSDGVIHLAGVLGTSELLEDVRAAVRVNVEAAVNVYDACLASHVPVVQIATGNANWVSPYPATKECAVRLAQCYAQDAGLKLAVVRAFHAYGPYQKHAPVRKFIPNAIRSALLDEPVTIFGDGDSMMDPIWVGDVADILVRALLLASEGGDLLPIHIFEAGTGRGLSVNQVADLVWKVIQGEHVAPKIHFPMRAGEPLHSACVADVTSLWPLFEELPFRFPFIQFIQFEDGIQETVAWYRAHPGVLGL